MRYKSPLKQILEQTRRYWDREGVSLDERIAFRKVLQCRTPMLGAERFASDKSELIVYHTCKSRACASCGHWATIKWQHDRLTVLPPLRYKGITFTMPKPLWRVFRDNRSLADALPALAAGAMQSLGRASHGLRIGVIAILHTFTGSLEFNSHVHTMVSAGGLQSSSGAWIDSVFQNNNLLMKLWRTAVLDLIRTALRAGVLRTEMSSGEMEAMLKSEERWWSVKIQSFKSMEHFLQYAGRYARRPPIAQRRIVDIGQGSVTFWTKDKRSKRLVAVKCALEEFVDRWRQHLLKRYRHSVRYFGLFAPRAVSQHFDTIFALIGHTRMQRPAPLRWSDSLRQLTGKDPLLDSSGQRMRWVNRLAPQASL